MEFEPPKAKKDMNERRRVEVLVSTRLRSCEERKLNWMLKRRNSGMLVALDCVIARRM